MRRRRLLVGAVALVLTFVGVAAGSRSHDSAAPAAATTTTTTATTAPSTTTTTAPPPVAGEAADPVGDYVDLYAAPGDATPTDTLTNPTWEQVPLALAVKEHGPPGWLRVQYNKRPNEATAWIHADQVVTRPVANRIVVSLSGRTLTVYEGRSPKVLLQAPVAVGSPRTPTPTGSFYVDVIVDLTVKTGAYGPYQVSVSAFSDVWQSFGGGVGQMAIHGTNQPELIGQDISNGCVRMHNDDIVRLVPLVRTGTPVEIDA